MILPDGRTLDAHSEPIETTDLGAKPDPDWVHVDAQGHEHRYLDGQLPTLRYVVDEEDYTVEDEDGYPEEYPGSGHHECTTCGEHVTPGTGSASGWQTFIPGPVTYLLDGQPITKDHAEALVTGG